MKKINTLDYLKHSALGVLICLIVSVVLTGIYAYLILAETIDISSTSYMIPIVQFITSIAGAIYLCSAEHDQLLVKCFIQAAVCLTLLILIVVTFYAGQFQINAISVLLVFLGYIGTALVQNKKKRRTNPKRYKYKNS